MILLQILPTLKPLNGIKIRNLTNNGILHPGQVPIKTKNYTLIKHQFHHLSQIATDLISLLRKREFNQAQEIIILH